MQAGSLNKHDSGVEPLLASYLHLQTRLRYLEPTVTARQPYRLALVALGLLVAACGGAEVDSTSNGDESPCGPNGHLHSGAGVSAHCDCDPGYTVVDGTCVEAQSTPPTPPASTDPDCGPNGVFDGRICKCDPGYTQTGLRQTRTCVQVPACQGADDQYEPNDEPSQASTITQFDGPLYACPADADWFVLSVTAGDRVRVGLRFSGAEVDLDLYLYGPSAQGPRAFSLSSNSDSEVAEFVARADGAAGVLVVPYGIGEGTYQLTVKVDSGAPPMCLSPGEFCNGSADCCSAVCHQGHCH